MKNRWYFSLKLNHGDTVTLSYTGITSVILFKLSVSVVKKIKLKHHRKTKSRLALGETA